MSVIKEFREFFLRNSAVFVGTKKDQQINYPTKYTALIDGVYKTVFNRFLKDHYPSEDVFKKLFESLAFKLNTEDTATTTTQGLVEIAILAELLANSNLSTNGYQLAISPQLLNSYAASLLSTVGGNKLIHSLTQIIENSDFSGTDENIYTYIVPAGTLVNIGDELEINTIFNVYDIGNAATDFAVGLELTHGGVTQTIADGDIVTHNNYHKVSFKHCIVKTAINKFKIVSQGFLTYQTREVFNIVDSDIENLTFDITLPINLNILTLQAGDVTSKIALEYFSVVKKPLQNTI